MVVGTKQENLRTRYVGDGVNLVECLYAEAVGAATAQALHLHKLQRPLIHPVKAATIPARADLLPQPGQPDSPPPLIIDRESAALTQPYCISEQP
jgi:hypothetical protein